MCGLLPIFMSRIDPLIFEYRVGSFVADSVNENLHSLEVSGVESQSTQQGVWGLSALLKSFSSSAQALESYTYL
jgi:hypothetical protein